MNRASTLRNMVAFKVDDGPWTPFDHEHEPGRIIALDVQRDGVIVLFSTDYCSSCKRHVASRWEIDQHNLACAYNGERSYPKPLRMKGE
jgi:hypothetical protein